MSGRTGSSGRTHLVKVSIEDTERNMNIIYG